MVFLGTQHQQQESPEGPCEGCAMLSRRLVAIPQMPEEAVVIGIAILKPENSTSNKGRLSGLSRNQTLSSRHIHSTSTKPVQPASGTKIAEPSKAWASLPQIQIHWSLLHP